MDVWTNDLDLPTWKRLEGAESLDVTELGQMAGRGPTHFPLTGMDKGSWRRPPARLTSALRHPLGLCHWLPQL